MSDKKSMVGWYDPGQLINTGVQVVVSDLIGTRFDARREEALAAKGDEKLIDYSQEAVGDFGSTIWPTLVMVGTRRNCRSDEKFRNHNRPPVSGG